MKTKEYKGFKYVCVSPRSERNLKAYIDSLGEHPTELPDASEENYEAWKSDYNFSGVMYLELPETITRIGKCAFAQSQIGEIVADGVIDIDELAFYNTQNLSRAIFRCCKNLVATDKSGEATDGSDAFNHSAVKELVLPKVERVGRYAFYDMPNLETLALPSATKIEPYAVYGNNRLTRAYFDSLKSANFALMVMNPSLNYVFAGSLRKADEQAFYANGEFELDAPRHEKTRPEADYELDYSKRLLNEARREETFDYEFNYKGFAFNLVDGLDEQAREDAKSKLCRFVDMVIAADGKIALSPNAMLNESGFGTLVYVKDIYMPPMVKRIGDYAFAKCYGLESVVAPGVYSIGDHAFYCDGGLRYVKFDSCEELEHDVFNGASCDYASFELHPEGKGIAKIFIPKVQRVGRHAFWQTGFRVIEMPLANTVMPTAFEENKVLQRVVVENLDFDFTFSMNPQLREVLLAKQKATNKPKVYGSPYLEKCGSQPTNR